jgi:hypothetical protein
MDEIREPHLTNGRLLEPRGDAEEMPTSVASRVGGWVSETSFGDTASIWIAATKDPLCAGCGMGWSLSPALKGMPCPAD